MEGAEGYGHVPDCGFAVCCLEETLLEVAQVKGAGQPGEGVSAEKIKAPAFLVVF